MHLYRAAIFTYRKTWQEEVGRHDGDHTLADRRVALNAAVLAVQQVAPETDEEVAAFVAKARAWLRWNFNAWLRE